MSWLWLVAFGDLHGENTPLKAHVKLPLWPCWIMGWEEMCMISFHNLVRTGSWRALLYLFCPLIKQLVQACSWCWPKGKQRKISSDSTSLLSFQVITLFTLLFTSSHALVSERFHFRACMSVCVCVFKLIFVLFQALIFGVCLLCFPRSRALYI